MVVRGLLFGPFKEALDQSPVYYYYVSPDGIRMVLQLSYSAVIPFHLSSFWVQNESAIGAQEADGGKLDIMTGLKCEYR